MVVRRVLSIALKILVVVAVLGGSAAALLMRQDLYDWWRLRGYDPPPRIVELADNVTMTSYGRKLFYVHRPELNDRHEFNRNCSGHEQTIVLGCYITHSNIYVFDVTDPRLEGIEEVTAAHEMLHAAYDRLSPGEQARINRLTADFFAKLTDERIKKVVASYDQRDPASVPHELHSILGTEIRELTDELEAHYAQYFSNRQAVVAYSEQYEGIFTEQRNRIESLASAIDRLHSELAAEKIVIDQFENEISSRASQLEHYRAQGNFEAYNAGIPAYNQSVNRYRSLIAAYNTKVKTLNDYVSEHNLLAVEQKQLINAISSHEVQL